MKEIRPDKEEPSFRYKALVTPTREFNTRNGMKSETVLQSASRFGHVGFAAHIRHADSGLLANRLRCIAFYSRTIPSIN